MLNEMKDCRMRNQKTEKRCELTYGLRGKMEEKYAEK